MARKQVIFWLDDSDPLQAEMLNYLAQLKQDRAFAPTMRAALMLIADLRENRVTELEKQFPFVVTHYRDEYRPTPPAAAPPDDETKQRLALLEQVLLQNAAPNGLLTPTSQPSQLPATIGHPMPLGLPHAIDVSKGDLPTLEITSAASDNKATQNFLASMSAITEKPLKTPAKVSQKHSSKPKQLEGFTPLPVPNIDELEIAL